MKISFSILRGKFNKTLEYITITLLLLTIINVFVDVVLRYVFNNSYIALQELEWHLFSSLFLLGMSYALQKDVHVRVDVFYQNYQQNTQAIINLIGSLLLILPISVIVTYHGIDFAYQSFLLNEQSGDPGGLRYRFIIKSIMPIGFILLGLSALNFAYRAWAKLTNKDTSKPQYHQEGQL